MKTPPKRFKPQEIEQKWCKYWDEIGLHRWDPSRSREETFVVDSPPPTVSGSLHVGHVFSYTHQDLIVRQRRMKGMNIFYPMGWDDNGLPTERRVQNLYNVRCDPHLPYEAEFKAPKKKARAALVSRKKFIELCEEVTQTDEQAFKDLWQTLGLSIDWEQEYATIDTHCRRTSQASFLRLLEDGQAYNKEAPTLWDVDFQTAVAQAEVVDKNLPGAFHNIRFGIEGGGSFTIATTRPELLPACVAVIAHPDDPRYQSLFGKRAITPLFRVPVKIIADELADPEKGTGILMVCTFGDTMDVEWRRRYDLPLRQIVGRNGCLMAVTFGISGWESLDAEAANASYQALNGLYIKKAQRRVVELLREESAEALAGLGVPLTEEPRPIEHAVKLYEKGDRPLEIITTRQWFVHLMDKKEALLAQGAKIQWHPPFMRTRYDHWVEGLNQDWCISRQRYFGVPFPVWYHLDARGVPLYDRPITPDPSALPVDPLAEPAPGFEESQRGVPGGFTGDPDVMDTWATSSLTPQIATHWVDDPAQHQKLFPMDLRPQAHEIIRTWAFYTIAKTWLHSKEIPWHHVVISGWILDPDRKKMSKSQGNALTPHHLLDRYSADAVRYWTARARLGVDTAYDEALFGNGKKLVNKLFNATRFVVSHLESVDVSQLSMEDVSEPLDQSFLSKLEAVVGKAGRAFDGFEFASALTEIEAFFWADQCDNYLELVKGRAYGEELSTAKRSALATLKHAISIQIRLFAPFLPFLTEELWSWTFATSEGRERSVHSAPWPEVSEFEDLRRTDEGDVYEAAVTVLREVRRMKGEAQVSMRTPVEKLIITGEADDLRAFRAAQGDVVAASSAEQVMLEEGAVEDGRFQIQVQLPATASA